MRLRLLAIGALGGALPVIAQAQPPVPASRFSDDVVVSASTTEEAEDRLPVSVTVVARDEIEARQATEVVDLLRDVPGLSVAQSGSPGHVASLFSRGTSSSHTLALWNGVPLNDPFFGGYDWSQLALEGVERVEIVRGPFSSLYGSSALGGVVQVLSGPSEGVSLRAEGGGDGYGRLALAAGHASERFRFDASGHLRTGDGQLDNDDWESGELVARGEWSLGRGTVGVLARAHASELGIPLSSGAATPNRRQRMDSVELALPLRGATGEWTFDALASVSASDLLFEDPDDPFLSASDTAARRLRARGAASRRLGPDAWLAGGTEWERQEVDYRTRPGGVQVEGRQRETWAVFAEAHTSWGRFSLDAGVRQDEDSQYGGQTSPKLGLVVRAGPGVRLHAAYGRGFRAPSLGEVYFPFFGNPDLRPERSDALEIGLSWEGQRWSVGLTAFENDLRDLIGSDPLTFQAVNIGRAETRGIEASAAYRLRLLKVQLNATLLDAVDLGTGEALLRRPEETASLLLGYDPGAWRLHLGVRYVGRRPDFDPASFQPAVNPAYQVVDVAARFQLRRRLAPYARLENLLGDEYEEVLGYPAPGRTLVVGVALQP